jgi:hypothetical protein
MSCGGRSLRSNASAVSRFQCKSSASIFISLVDVLLARFLRTLGAGDGGINSALVNSGRPRSICSLSVSFHFLNGELDAFAFVGIEFGGEQAIIDFASIFRRSKDGNESASSYFELGGEWPLL